MIDNQVDLRVERIQHHLVAQAMRNYGLMERERRNVKNRLMECVIGQNLNAHENVLFIYYFFANVWMDMLIIKEENYLTNELVPIVQNRMMEHCSIQIRFHHHHQIHFQPIGLGTQSLMRRNLVQTTMAIRKQTNHLETLQIRLNAFLSVIPGVIPNDVWLQNLVCLDRL